jgi:Protein of unknown function (DUF2924)
MTISQQVAELPGCSLRELQLRYAEVFGEATSARNKGWLVKRIAWRIQAQAEGDLSERARRRIAELADDADLRILPPRAKRPAAEQVVSVRTRVPADRRLPIPGTVLTRSYKGKDLHVQVLDSGSEHDGVVYRSLSAVAKAITGTHLNGYAFFRLEGGRS